MRRMRSGVVAGIVASVLAACAGTPVQRGSTEAAFVVLGEGGRAIVRVVTRDASCPPLDVDGAALPMNIRAVPETLPPRTARGDAAKEKPSAFPVLVCERTLPFAAARASVGGRALAIPQREPRRIVVLGDTGCVIGTSNSTIQNCNDPNAWPLAQIASAAAAKRPDLVIHLGDYVYRENACPAGNAKCADSPWGYGWDAWNADFFTAARPLLAAAPWVFVRGNHESCGRAGQGWWRLLDPRLLLAGRDCNDAINDVTGDYSEPYVVPLSSDTQLIVFDSSRARVNALRPNDPMFVTYSAQMKEVVELAKSAQHNFFINHQPILGFATDPTRNPPGVYPGNEPLQSVLRPINGDALFPSSIDALFSGHDHVFEMISFATPQPTQFISGTGGGWLDDPLPQPLPAGAMVAPGAVIDKMVSNPAFGFLTIERASGEHAAWRVQAWDVFGRLFTTCVLRDRKANCTRPSSPG